MRIFIAAIFCLILCACTSVGREADIRDGFVPVAIHIPQYESAVSLNYRPHVHGAGLAAVNDAVNEMPYLPDANEKHVLDADKFWRVGGDCEEYALIKMLELRAQGISDTYYMVFAKDFHSRSHAVLAAPDAQGSLVVLDNKNKQIVSLDRYYRTHPLPFYFIDGNGRTWRQFR